MNVWLSMMPGHGAKPIFFNKKNKDWTSRTHAKPPLPYVRYHLSLALTPPPPPPPLKADVISSYVHHPKMLSKNFRHLF